MNMIYHPLPQGDYIRLLDVWVDPSTDELVCRFKVIALDDEVPDYKVTSYAWEDPSPLSTIKFTDGQSLPLSSTLSKLFASLQKRSKTFTVWIDALCINQEDDEEKASQVSLMGKVYSHAEQVLLWLGSSAPETETAFRFMESKQTLSWPEDWENDLNPDLSGLNSIFSLLERPWFQRVWVIQEVILSNNVLMMCGDDSIDFDSFRICIFAVWKFIEDWTGYDGESNALKGLWCVTRLMFMRDEFQDTGSVRYEILLQAAFHCQATDKRDMVFAFKGIADTKRPVPVPDYKMPVEDVYTKTAIALLCHGTSLDLLALSGIASRKYESNLPTWVPDLRHHSYSEPFVPCERAGWNTGGVVRALPTLNSPDQLRIQGTPIDTVMETCSIFDSYSMIDQKTALQEILALRQKVPVEVAEETWLDKVAESLTLGVDIEDDPVDISAYRDEFKDWLQLLLSSSTQDDIAALNRNVYHRTIGPKIDGWKAFLTKKGYFCIGPPSVEQGDFVSIVPGCRFPLVLRTDPRASANQSLPECILVSWCYTHGLMFGEVNMAEQRLVDILVR
jgi:hypothetical protein